MNKRFHDIDGNIILEDGVDQLMIPRSLFLKWEPEYTLPEGKTQRYYNGTEHWVEGQGSQKVAVDVDPEQLEEYIAKLKSYQQRMPTPEPVTAENWAGLESALRGSTAWSRAWDASTRSVRAQAAFTMLLVTLTTTHVKADLSFAWTELRRALQEQNSLTDFDEAELAEIEEALRLNHFNPTEFGF